MKKTPARALREPGSLRLLERSVRRRGIPPQRLDGDEVTPVPVDRLLRQDGPADGGFPSDMDDHHVSLRLSLRDAYERHRGVASWAGHLGLRGHL